MLLRRYVNRTYPVNKKGIADKIGCVIQYPCANISKTNTIRYCKLLLALLIGHMQRRHREQEKMLQLTHNLTKNKIQMICCLHRGKSPSIKNGIPQIKKTYSAVKVRDTSGFNAEQLHKVT